MIEITVEGADKLQARMVRTASRWEKDSHEILSKTRAYMLTSLRLNFDESGRPTRWPPLKYRSGKPLILTGRLRRAAIGRGESIREEQHSGGKHSIEFGVNPSVFYGKFQQFGTSRGIPPRPFILFQENDKTALMEMVARWYFTAFEGVR